MKNSKLTSVKVLTDLYKRFKIDTIDKKMNLQKLTNRSMNLYLSDIKFKNKLELHSDLIVSGSNL